MSPDSSTPPTAAPPPRLPRLLVAAIVGLALVGGGGIAWLTEKLRQLQRDYALVDERGVSMAQKARQLEAQLQQLSADTAHIERDRDNLLAVTKQAQEKQQEAEGVRNLLEKILQRTGEENRLMEARLPEMEQELRRLQTERDRLAEERVGLEQRLSKQRQRSEQKKLQDQLSVLRKREEELERATTTARRDVQEAAAEAKRLRQERDQLQARLDQLQKEYAEEVSSNASLRRQTERLPKDVTRIAREHERLVQELADTHYNMGVSFSERADYVRAAKEFEQVLDLRPQDPDALYNLGVIYAEHLPDRAKATKCFTRYLSLDSVGRGASYAKQYIASWRAWEGKERLE